MIGKFLFFLSAATATFLGLSAGAVTTSQNVDIIVTHGAPLTTFTFVNDTGNTLPAGSPVSFGQAFRYGDILPATYPLIRDAATHVALPGQQWDEISTWRENGGNGSWRHAVWAAWLPRDLAAGATYQVEFVTTSGTYSESSHQALSALCSGPAAHDLKIHLTDVRNQADTVRDSGDATFRLCDNIANTGRDAPRHLRAGSVYDEYQVNGMFVYSGTGHVDPLLYAQCNVDIFTKASDGVSAGDVRWVCHLINAWENVAAGSTGNAGNPGPTGFANDPQAVSYRVEVDDGPSDVLDWNGLDATVSSASNPVHLASSSGCDTTAGGYCLLVPSSVGANQWYYGQATRVSCAGTCVGGLTNGQLYYIWPSSSAASGGGNTQYVSPMVAPNAENSSVFQMTGSQGSGTTSFSTRIQHYHWEAWQTLDWTGQPNWSPFGTTSRVTRKVYPAFTAAEKTYWEQSGMIVPLYLGQPINPITPNARAGQGSNFEPFARMTVTGGTQGGPRPDLGISNDYSAQAWVTGTESAWDYMRLFTYGSPLHGYAVFLNEATGRIPVLNNGPPTGPGGNGNGGSYAGLGAPQNQLTLTPALTGMADVPHNQPNPSYDITGGIWGWGTYISHMPSFNGFTYAVFGDRHFLDIMHWRGNADFMQQRVGPGPELGQSYYRDNNAVFTDGKTYHYWGLLIACCQTRGSAWMIRDITYPAAFGGDSNIERSYYHDFLAENGTYYPMFQAFKDGPGSTGYSGSIHPPNDVGTGVPVVDTFQIAYVASVAYIMQTWLHEPLAGVWNTKLQRYYEGVCGGQLAGALPAFYCIDYNSQPDVHNGDGFFVGFAGNVGQYGNGTDASDFGAFSAYTNFVTGGQLQENNYVLTAGDTIKQMNAWFGIPNIDQMPGTQWFEVIGPIDRTAGTFYIRCPVGHPVDATCPTPGAAFSGFTRGGVPVVNEFNADQFKYRPAFDPGPGNGYADSNYVQYGGQTINGLNVLGYDVTHAMSEFNTRAGTGYYNSNMPSYWWDPTIVVPGLPTPHNGL